MIGEWPKTIAIVIASEDEADAVIALMQPIARNVAARGRRDQFTPIKRVAIRIAASLVTLPGECMLCGCREDDCSECIQKTGEPCFWVNQECTICSACLGIVAS
jgi:hypothetical protein